MIFHNFFIKMLSWTCISSRQDTVGDPASLLRQLKCWKGDRWEIDGNTAPYFWVGTEEGISEVQMKMKVGTWEISENCRNKSCLLSGDFIQTLEALSFCFEVKPEMKPRPAQCEESHRMRSHIKLGSRMNKATVQKGIDGLRFGTVCMRGICVAQSLVVHQATSRSRSESSPAKGTQE